MSGLSKVQIAYGVFLILCGVVGYLSNPAKAQTALASGGLFGALNIALGVLSARGWPRALPIALGICVMLAGVFTWRSIVSWMAHLDRTPNKLVPALLISAMLLATLVMGALLIPAVKAGRSR